MNTYCTLFFTHCFTLFCQPVTVSTTLSYLMPSFEPLNRAAAVFKLVRKNRKASGEQKNGRSVTLRRFYQRHTRAKTQARYHDLETMQGFFSEFLGSFVGGNGGWG